MNTVCLVGRITSKPELKYNSSNIPYTRFSIAVDRAFKSANGEKQTDFINIVVWRKQAENICQYLDKGSLIGLEGRIQTGSYVDHNNNKRYTTDIIADNVQFLERRKESSNITTSKQQNESENEENDVFKDFGEQVAMEMDNNYLE